jgi:hypothetical protein
MRERLEETRPEVAKELGFEDVGALRDAKWFAALQEGERQRLMEDYGPGITPLFLRTSLVIRADARLASELRRRMHLGGCQNNAVGPYPSGARR